MRAGRLRRAQGDRPERGQQCRAQRRGSQACRVRKSIRHAARAYSWMSPPRRSRRWILSGGFEPTRC